MSNNTLTKKIFFRVTPTILVTIALIGAFAFHSATREINHVYDAQLINNANVLWMLLRDEFEESGATTPKQIEDADFEINDQLSLNDDADDYAEARMFRAWKSGKMLMFSSTAFSADIPEQKPGFSKVLFHNDEWRVYALVIPNTSILIEVGEKTSLRNALVSNILLNLFFPLLILVPIIAILIWFSIRNGLGTIRVLVGQIRSRSPDDLSSIPIDNLPRDLSPLGKSINQLLSKLKQSLTAERRFTEHAAHQLRTPQAGSKLLLQMLSKTDNDEERKAIITDLITSNKKATQLIEQLLSAARVSHQPITLQPVALYKTTASIIAEMGHLVMQKRLDIALEGQEDAYVRADESLLTLLISNLIENAIKFTPIAGVINVAITPDEKSFRLSITDSGPGIPENQRKSVFQRFYRIDAQHYEGTGLGLAIVAEIAERLNANVTLNSPESNQGLLVEVILPKA